MLEKQILQTYTRHTQVAIIGFFLLIGCCAGVQAHNKVVVVPLMSDDADDGDGGPRFDNTILVKGDKAAVANGEALVAAIRQAATEASLADPWLIKLEAGVYDVTNPSANAIISDGVHLRGAGAQNSIIRGGNVAINSAGSSISDLAYITENPGEGVFVGDSNLAVRDIFYEGVNRGLRVLSCDTEQTISITGSTFRVDHASDSNPDNDVISLGGSCVVTIESSRFFGSDDDDGLFIGSGSLTIVNSFIEDDSSPLDTDLSAVCKDITTLDQTYASNCP